MDEVRGPGDPGTEAGIKLDCNEIRRRRMERFALKRKFASLSSRLDRAHRQARFPLASSIVSVNVSGDGMTSTWL
jgi:hypothetical protein